MSHRPTVTLKTKPQVVVVKGRAKGPTVVLKPKAAPRIMWQFTDRGDGSLHLEASNPYHSAGTRYLVTRMPDEPRFPPRFKFTRSIFRERRCWRVSWLCDMGVERFGFVYRSALPARRKFPWSIVDSPNCQFKTRSVAAAWLQP
jgi:hypothetical protein